jgi:hypothetical protein
MKTDDPASRGFSLKRWSQRKLEAARAASSAPVPEPPPSALEASAPSAANEPAPPPTTTGGAVNKEIAAEPTLPPVDSLTIDSDFSAFLGPKVDPAMKLQALKKLFSDPRFNVMDGLDVYIDDYSIADPLPPEIARTLAHARYVFDPPRTRITEAGIVEDIPADEAEADAEAAEPGASTQPQATIPARAAPPEPAAPSAATNPGANSPTDEGGPREGSGLPRR